MCGIFSIINNEEKKVLKMLLIKENQEDQNILKSLI